jgi:Dolichyl-phosphate-mannose-protein mannosyltransferase
MKIVLSALFFLLILASSLWLRFPTLNEGEPFFYHEDEAHHFNRIVTMVQKASFNPEYFHKPSLHFYLRMPAVLIGYYFSKRAGEINSINEIKTRNRYGLARYSFSWSHPKVVWAVRAVSLLLTMLTCFLVFVIARQLKLSFPASLLALAIFSSSPEIYNYSSFIGVDTPLMFFCLLSCSIALAVTKNLTRTKLWFLGIICGFAVSCKYNGLPIAILPILSLVAARQLKNPSYLISALLAPVIGFFIGSPYILVSSALFLKHIKYEIWHYAVAGHEEHSATPGIAQVLHYGRWLLTDGLGTCATVCALIGIVVALRSYGIRAIIFISFPILFFILMCAQKVNFVRNMIPVLPFLAILAAVFLNGLIQRITKFNIGRYTLYLLAAFITITTPLLTTLTLRAQSEALTDTRNDLFIWQKNNLLETAISGDLQPQVKLTKLNGVTVIDPTIDLDQLYQSGFDRLITKGSLANKIARLTVATEEKHFLGTSDIQRVPQSPDIHIYKLVPSKDLRTDLIKILDIKLGQPLIEHNEEHLWLTERTSKLKFEALNIGLKNGMIKLELEIMSPWNSQQIEFVGENWNKQILLNHKNPGEWHKILVDVPAQAFNEQKSIYVSLKRVSSPLSHKLNADTRRLGVAIKKATQILE